MSHATQRYGTNMTKVLSNEPADAVPASEYRGRVRHQVDTVEVAGAHTANDYYTLAHVPRDAVLIPHGCLIHADALGAGFTTAKFGYVVSSTTANWLRTAGSLATATTQSAVSGINRANYAKPLWELLGYTTRRNCPEIVPLSVRTSAAPTTAGTLTVEMLWSEP